MSDERKLIIDKTFSQPGYFFFLLIKHLNHFVCRNNLLNVLQYSIVQGFKNYGSDDYTYMAKRYLRASRSLWLCSRRAWLDLH